jgi:short-subunit dehydrogenase
MPTALILGAGSDIGMAIAGKFASNQFDLQLAARRPDLLEPLRADIRIRYGVNVSLHAFDALDYAAHASFFSGLSPCPDLTVCVFGLLEAEGSAFSDWPVAEKMIHTNFTGAVSILNVAARHYMAAGQGGIIGISSVAGERGRASRLIYASAKAGFTVYLSGLRNKCWPAKVHVMTVLPGFVYTRMTENMSLPALLTATPGAVADRIYRAYLKKRDVIYIKWCWRYIMLAIRCIPESWFKKMKL